MTSAAATPDAIADAPEKPVTKSNKYPPGIPFIVGNEAAERFSFYGMKAILAVHLKALILGFAAESTFTHAQVEQAQNHATEINHLFIAGVYAFPMIGALAADRLVGKYRIIMWLSVVYCIGHAVLGAADHLMVGMIAGLGLIAVGSGGIKPCVSANVGDQFDSSNGHLVRNVYLIFYLSINFGSFFATLLIPKLYDADGLFPAWTQLSRAKLAFGVPGILMALATLIFFLGSKRFVKVPARPGGLEGLLDVVSGTLLFTPLAMFLFGDGLGIATWTGWGVCTALFVAGIALFLVRLYRLGWDDGFLGTLLYAVLNPDKKRRIGGYWSIVKERFGEEAAEGPWAVAKIAVVFSMVTIFWALFDQHSSTWVFQAGQMNRDFDWPVIGHVRFSASQISALNPLFVMLLIPLLGQVGYPLLQKLGFEPTPLRRMTAGMLLSGFAFVAVALVQRSIDAAGPGHVTVAWQAVPYAIMTLAEVLVSATGLEFAYTQAPRRMKSTIMSFWLLTVSLGNKLVAWLAASCNAAAPDATWAGYVCSDRTGSLENFFWVFAVLMAVAGVVFAGLAFLYRGKTYLQQT